MKKFLGGFLLAISLFVGLGLTTAQVAPSPHGMVASSVGPAISYPPGETGD